MNRYEGTVTFSFTGTVEVNAESEEKARRKLKNGFWLILGGSIHTSGPVKDIPNWDFDMHPEKTIDSITLVPVEVEGI